MTWRVFILGFFLFQLTLPPLLAQTYSQLWGKKGEKWDRQKLPDFTNAGYQSGNKPIPSLKKGVNVQDFGAKGDGVTDDTRAFRNAIAACPVNRAVVIPKGIYRITDTLQIKRSGVALRGDDKEKSIIFFEKGIEELYPNYNTQSRNQTKWSWSGSMLLFSGKIENCGVENLTIKFPDNKWDGHNFHERGYNAVGFSEGAHNGWIRNVILTGTDMGIWIARNAHHITAENWVLNFGPVRGAERLNGHHGVNIYGGHNLLQGFEIKGKFHHDLSVESKNSVYNVFRDGKGVDICIDHHNHDQAKNLFTNLNLGVGSRAYNSGGNATPRGISFEETYWNLISANTIDYVTQYNSKEKQSARNIQVGIQTDKPSSLGDENGNWFESITPKELHPQDLYKAQMKLLKK
jgi:hypothetical protein